MMGCKAVSCLHGISDAYRRAFFRDRKMKHAARGLLAHKHFPDPFLEGSDLSHPAVDIERGFAVWCHGGGGFFGPANVRVLVVVVVVVGLEGWRSVRSTVWRDVGLSSCGLFIALGRTQFRGRGRGRG